MKSKIAIFICLISVFISGCNRALDKKDYIAWVRDYDNGLHKKVEFQEVIVDVQYKPIDLLLLTENVALASDSSQMNKKNDFEGMTYFTVKIRHKSNKDIFKYNLSSESEYYNRLYYFSFGFKDEITLKVGDQTFPCVAYHFEKSYSMSPDKTFLLGFETDKLADDKNLTLVINDKAFSNHVFEITYTIKELKSIPKLKL